MGRGRSLYAALVVAVLALTAIAPAAPVKAQVVSQPAQRPYGQTHRDFEGVPLWTRGYIPDNCLAADDNCAYRSGRFAPEQTAQAKALRFLAGGVAP